MISIGFLDNIAKTKLPVGAGEAAQNAGRRALVKKSGEVALKGAGIFLKTAGVALRFIGPVGAIFAAEYVGPDKKRLELIPEPDEEGSLSFRRWSEAGDYYKNMLNPNIDSPTEIEPLEANPLGEPNQTKPNQTKPNSNRSR